MTYDEHFKEELRNLELEYFILDAKGGGNQQII